MNLSISTGFCPNHLALNKLKTFGDDLNQASDPFELCLHTLPLYVMPQDGNKTDRDWSAFQFPIIDNWGYHVLRVFKEWFLSLNQDKRTVVVHECIEQPIVATCTKSTNLDSMYRLISFLHLQNQFSPQLCFIPLVISGANMSEYMAGFDRPQLVQLGNELHELKSEEMQLAELAKANNVRLDVCRNRVQQCLDRCWKPLLETSPKQLSSDICYLSHLKGVEGGRQEVRHLLCQRFFPDASDPFALLLEVFNIMRGTVTTWAQFRLPKKKSSFGMVVIDAFSRWFQSLDDAEKTKVVDSFIKNPLEAACSDGNSKSMCRLATRLRLQPYIFDPEIIVIPAFIKDLEAGSNFASEYLNGCDGTLVEQFAIRLDALLHPNNQNELREFSRRCMVTVPFPQHTFAKLISKCQNKYDLDDSDVPNALAVFKLPETQNPICRRVFPLWLGADGRAKLIEWLTQTHFPTATHPFALLRLLIAPDAQSWNKLRLHNWSSAYRDTVMEAFKIWLHSLEIDKADHVFNEFIKQPIKGSCQNGNNPAMCYLLTKLDLYEKFENEEVLIVLPTIFKHQCPLVVGYLNGCCQDTRQRFLSCLDSFLAMSDTERAELLEKCGISRQVQCKEIAQAVASIQRKFDIPDSFAPNVTAFRAKEESFEKTLNLISSSGPWKHLSPPQRMIELYRKNRETKK